MGRLRWAVTGGLFALAGLVAPQVAAAQLEFPTACESGPFYLTPAEEAEYLAINQARGFEPLPPSCLSARLSEAEREIIRFINIARLERGLYTYECDDRLIDIAKLRSDDNASRCVMEHFDGAGRRYDQIMTDEGYHWPSGTGRVVGEVITSGSDPRGAVAGWMGSCVGHYPQLVAKDLTAIATSIGHNPACPPGTFKTYTFAIFGNVPMVYPDDLEGGGGPDGGSGPDGGVGTDGGGDDDGGTGGDDGGGGPDGGPSGDATSSGCTVRSTVAPSNVHGHLALLAFLGVMVARRTRRRGRI